MPGSTLYAKFTLEDVEDQTVDAVIDWDSADNPGVTVTTHTALASNGVVQHAVDQAVSEDRRYVVKVTATDSAGNDTVATSSVEVVANKGPKIVILSLTSGQ